VNGVLNGSPPINKFALLYDNPVPLLAYEWIVEDHLRTLSRYT